MVLMILDVQNALIQAYPYNEQNVIDNMNKRIACICQTVTRYRDSMGTKRYMNMEHLKELDLQNQSDIIAGCLPATHLQ